MPRRPCLCSSRPWSLAWAAALAAALGGWGCNDEGSEAPSDASPVDASPLDATRDGEPSDAIMPSDAVTPSDAIMPSDDMDLPDAAVERCTLPAPAPVRHAVGAWTVVADAPRGEWHVERPDGAIVMRSAAACVDGVATPVVRTATGTPGLQNQFGAFRVHLDGRLSRLDWVPIAARPSVRIDDDAVALVYGGAHDMALVFRADGDGLRVALESEGEAPDAASLAWACGADEAFFGLGTQVTGLDLRGRRYPLFTQEQGIGKPEDGHPYPLANFPEAAYAPMGVWHTSDGMSALVTHDAYSDLDLCGADEGRVELRSYAGLPGVVLMTGETPRDRVRAAAQRIGLPRDVPDWVFAPWNDAVGGPERLAAVAARLRAEGIPSSAIWTEDWIGGEQSPTGFRLSYAWAWDDSLYPDLPDDIEALHARGFAFLAYFNPFVPEPTRMFAEGTAGGWLVEDAADEVITFFDPAFRQAALVDLSDDGALAWLRDYQITAARGLGIDGWMADFAEWLPVEAVMEDGESGWRWHNRYPLVWQRANVAAMEAAHPPGGADAGDWTFFVRSGWASVNGGTGGITPALWAGDQNTDWARDDGLPTVIPIGVHAGLSGVAVYGSDIAGYTSETVPNTTKELFFRWSALGAFHPLMRTHHGSDECGNWAFDRDADTVAHYRRYARLHTVLYPYLRAMMDEAVAEGLPIVRHPWLTDPDRPAPWRVGRDVFLLGDALFVAPVVEPGVTAREVVLPGGGWWPLLGDAPLAGGEVQRVEAGYTEIPVFVRPGTALPLLPEAVDSFYGAREDGVTTLAGLGGARAVALYPDAAGAAAGRFGDVTVTAAGLGARPMWGAATLDGAALPACAEVEGVSCAAEDGVRLVGIGTAEVRIGDATVRLEGEGARDVTLMWAGEAFGPLRAPTPLGDLDPDVPPPCEE